MGWLHKTTGFKKKKKNKKKKKKRRNWEFALVCWKSIEGKKEKKKEKKEWSAAQPAA